MKRTRIRLAGIVAAAMATAFVGTAAPGAQAATPSPNPGIVDPSRTVTLNIYKFLGSPTTLPHNGTQQSVADPTHIPLWGVNFDVYRVFSDAALTDPIDLTTNADWAAVGDLTGYQVTAGDISLGSFTVNGVTYYLGTPKTTVTTGDDGLAQFTAPNGAGLYLVAENLSTSTTVKQCPTTLTCTTIDKSQVSPAYPFLVTLPMTDPNQLNSWMYDVYVYPKNQQATGSKTVADKNTQTTETGTVDGEGTTTGSPDTVTFTITTPITDGLTGTQMGLYKVVDQLDPRLTYGSLTVAIDPDGEIGPLAPTALTPAASYYGVTVVSGLVTVTLTDAGRDAIAAANADDPAATVVTTITVTVTGSEDTGAISNTAYFFPNQAFADSHTTGTATNSVTSYYGDLRLTKKDPTDTNVKMPLADFAVYIDPTPALGGATNTCTAADVNSDQTPVATGTTDANGLLTISGLQTSDYYNGSTQANKIYYCLVETKAPAGYNLNPQPISFVIPYGSIVGSNPAFLELTVNNAKSNFGSGLPFTGGQGVALLSVLGAVLLGTGVFFSMSTTRRRRNSG